MKLLKNILVMFIFTMLFAPISNAQNNSANHKIKIDIPNVALLGLISENSTLINPISANEAGNAIDVSNAANNNNLWINYSSVNRDRNHQRQIMAMVQGDVPAGIKLKLKASNANGSGKGNLGQPVGLITLSAQPAEVITNIGSCYTGRGIQHGHSLEYQIELDDNDRAYAQINAGNTVVNVIYTLTDIN